ncbi:MAG: preprotein translocase subunit YajC [Micrococcales bacterium]|nr:preprotein translocase subunit YajC [Micrococcales bacterium]
MLHRLVAEAEPAAGGFLSGNGFFFLLIALVIGAMLLMSSRGRKHQREQMEMRGNLAPGDEVMTMGGLFATVVSAEGDVVVLETSPGVESRWMRQAISKKVSPPVAADEQGAQGGTDADLDIDGDEFEVPDDLSGLEPGGSGDAQGSDRP